MRRLFIDKASIPGVITAGATFLILLLLINGGWGVAELLRMTGGVNILDFSFGYSAQEAYAQLDAMGEAGRAFYRTRIIPLDFPFPAAYALFYMSAMGFLLKGQGLGAKRYTTALLSVPLVAMLADWAENICILSMLNAYPDQLSVVSILGSCFTILKFVCTYATVAILVYLALRRVMLRVRKRRVV